MKLKKVSYIVIPCALLAVVLTSQMSKRQDVSNVGQNTFVDYLAKNAYVENTVQEESETVDTLSWRNEDLSSRSNSQSLRLHRSNHRRNMNNGHCYGQQRNMRNY